MPWGIIPSGPGEMQAGRYEGLQPGSLDAAHRLHAGDAVNMQPITAQRASLNPHGLAGPQPVIEIALRGDSPLMAIVERDERARDLGNLGANFLNRRHFLLGGLL